MVAQESQRMNDTRLFAFESDFVATLRCVPMAVRFKLDRCGIKLSLRQWSRFTRDDWQALLLKPCGDEGETDAYRTALTSLVASRAGEVAKPLAEPPCGRWEDVRQVAPAVISYARGLGVRPPSLAEWAALTTLQRFVLVKLTRDNHDNVNFVPAMREFGLANRTACGVLDLPARRKRTPALASHLGLRVSAS
jgi:hypothetical protein